MQVQYIVTSTNSQDIEGTIDCYSTKQLSIQVQYIVTSPNSYVLLSESNYYSNKMLSTYLVQGIKIAIPCFNSAVGCERVTQLQSTQGVSVRVLNITWLNPLQATFIRAHYWIGTRLVLDCISPTTIIYSLKLFGCETLTKLSNCRYYLVLPL